MLSDLSDAVPVKCVHDLELSLGMQLFELVEHTVTTLLEHGLVALEGLVDQVLGTVVLHLQFAQCIRQVTRCVLTELHLALALCHQTLQLLSLPIHRLRQALVVMLRGLVLIHQTVIAYRHLSQHKIIIFSCFCIFAEKQDL